MPAKAKAKTTTAKKKPASSPSSERMTKKRAMTKAGYEFVSGYAPTELAKELRKAIADAAPGQTKPGSVKPARKTPRSTQKGRAPATRAEQLAAGALAMGLLPLRGGRTREERIALTG